MAIFSSSRHQFPAPSVLSSKCPSDKFKLAITAHTCNSLLKGPHPFTTGSDLRVNNAPSHKAHQLMFDLTTAYYFWRAISTQPRDLLKSFNLNWRSTEGFSGHRMESSGLWKAFVQVFNLDFQDPDILLSNYHMKFKLT